MTLTEVNIKVPTGMTMYLKPQNEHSELVRNALLLYPYINDKTISHGKAAEILGILKYELILFPALSYTTILNTWFGLFSS